MADQRLIDRKGDFPRRGGDDGITDGTCAAGIADAFPGLNRTGEIIKAFGFGPDDLKRVEMMPERDAGPGKQPATTRDGKDTLQ